MLPKPTTKPQSMKATTAGIYRLMVCLWLLLGAQGVWAGYDAVVLDEVLYRVDATTNIAPDTVFGSGRTCNLYLNRDEVSTVDIGVAIKVGFVDNNLWSPAYGQRVTAKRLNLVNASFSFMSRYEQNGVIQSLAGNHVVEVSGSNWTDMSTPNVNGTHIFGLDRCGCVVTPVGQPIKELPGVSLNGGAYTVSTDTSREVYELWIVGAHGKLSASIRNKYLNLLALLSVTGTSANISIEVTNGVMVNSALSETEGCMKIPASPMALRFPTVYLENTQGPVKTGLVINSPTEMLVKNGRMGQMILQGSPDLVNWSTVLTTRYSLESLAAGDTKITFLPTGGGSTTHPVLPDGPRCFYRLALP